MSISTVLARWQNEPTIHDNITTWYTLPARQVEYHPIPEELHSDLALALRQQGIEKLYIHQALAWQYARLGKNIVIATGTASGKTLCYNLPVVDCLLRDPDARALYLFPTKALAQDQMNKIRQLLPSKLPSLNNTRKSNREYFEAIYDGDTPQSERSGLRDKARLILSNPDMLHFGILPYHTKWINFFSHLQYIIIDEMHTYRGVFGSHVANVIRRLMRIARFYGANPKFILTSATIGNSVEHAEHLTETPITLIDHDGSARGAQHFLLYNPPIINQELGLRQSVLQEALLLATDLLVNNVQTIIFGRSRRTVEILIKYLREKDLPIGEIRNSNDKNAIRGYRSGYLSRERRQIEQGLRSGKVRAVVATNALELGIDIGGMEASLLVGYPGTIASTWQQAGRAGRDEVASLAILLASSNPLDQFLVHHPDYFLGRSPEQALINPNHLLILLDHLKCSSFELPFQEGENFGDVPFDTLKEYLEIFCWQKITDHVNQKYFWTSANNPTLDTSLRNTSTEQIILHSDGGIFGEVDKGSAAWMVHPGAIYLHEAQTYLVTQLDMEKNIAFLQEVKADYYTEPKTETDVQLIQVIDQDVIQGAKKVIGNLSVISQVIGYRRVLWSTHELLDYNKLDLPSSTLLTTGFWIALSEETINTLRDEGLWGADPNDYGPRWEKQRNLARARDGFRCQVCGIAENGQAHHVHHKIPFRNFTSIDEANHLSNLITLCSNCHRRVETAVRVRSGLSGLAFALGHLAPLFLMCDSNDLGVYSEPQSSLSERSPVVVLYDRIPAGIGFSQKLFEIYHHLILSTKELVETCECQDGCPSCVGPGGENGRGGKSETLAILRVLCPPSPNN